MSDISLWNIATGIELTTFIEREKIELALPIANGFSGVELEIISGSLPNGVRLEGNKLVGIAFEVVRDTVFTFVVRAHWQGYFDDRTIKIIVVGPDAPEWRTPEGLLPVGTNNTFFILDSEPIDFQLLAVDPDVSAGDTLDYFIAEGDGVLPPGIELTRDGRLVGITEPLLSLDKRFEGGGYDTMPYGDFPLDYAVLPTNGYDSYFYDSQGFGFFEPTQSLRKLNRYYPFAVTVTDGDSFDRREFKIYLVGDDYLRVDNTVMKVSNGIFTADNTHIRTPKWLTPRDLGFRRANNYTTIYLDIIDPSTLSGAVSYTLENVNDDGTPSVLPPGLELDSRTGEIVGRIPYQPAITEDYKFTVRATRFTGDLEILEIFGNFYEDVLLGADNFKIYKIDLTGDLDGVNDLKALVNRNILLNNRLYTVINVDDRDPDYDLIFLDDTVGPNISLLLSRTALIGQNYMFVQRLDENQKNRYQGRTLNFGNNGSYIITGIVPYIEYEIEKTTDGPILPAGSPQIIENFDSYFVGDYAVYDTSTGGDGKIYKCLEAHTVEPQLNQNGIPEQINGVTQIVFESSKWQLVADTLSELSTNDQITATKQSLEDTFGGIAYIEVVSSNRWRIKLRSTAITRIASKIKEFFTVDNSFRIQLLRDNEHRLELSNNLQLQLNQGRNIGIALFKNDFFSEFIVIADTDDEVNVPSSTKTFELKVIGEIDSTIKWITDSNLGSIPANYVSNLKVEAETTVPDTRMIYRIVNGKLPFGMYLNYRGEIIGRANQFANNQLKGLTVFDNGTTSFDGFVSGITRFDREFKFTVEARDRFGYSAITKEFVLRIEDFDQTRYTDIVARPFLKLAQRDLYRQLISNSNIFTPDSIYRPDDINFGIQDRIEMLIYAGIEAKNIEHFVAAAAKNHKRKKYTLGEPTKAVAKETLSDEPIYEVVYVPVYDQYQSTKGKTRNSYTINTNNKITADSITYTPVDDGTRIVPGYTSLGYTSLPVYGRNIVRFIFTYNNDSILIETRDGTVNLNVDSNDFELDVRENGEVTVQLQLSDSEPYRMSPTSVNTIKADSDAVKVSNSKDQTRYISSIEHMRDRIKAVGENQREYLPLWMRTAQEPFQQLDYVSAIPICYCKPGTADDIILNIKNNGFDFKQINFDIDRYIIRETANTSQEQYILFANYQFNV
jgi:hypothetical protein